MMPSLHSQISGLPLMAPVVDVRPYIAGGRLYASMGRGDPLWLVELSKYPSDPKIVPIGRNVTKPPLMQNFFISVDKLHFHQLHILQDFEGPESNAKPFRAILTQMSDLPALAICWHSPHPALVFAPHEEIHLRRIAVQETLLSGAFYAYAQNALPQVPGSLQQWWDQLTASE